MKNKFEDFLDGLITISIILLTSLGAILAALFVLSLYLLPYLFLYVLGSFISLSFDVTTWSFETRFMLGFLSFVIMLLNIIDFKKE